MSPRCFTRYLFFLVIGLLFARCNGNRHATASADSQLKKKYAGLLGVPESEITNVNLYRFIDEWYGTPYKYGGKSKSGVDCSGFVSALYGQVYQKTIGGSAHTLYEKSNSIPEKKLEE